MEEKNKNYYHVRIYDLEVVKSIEELMKTGNFSTANELLGKAIAIGIEKIYLEYGKHKRLSSPIELPEQSNGQRMDDLDHKMKQVRLLQEDTFVLLNSVEGLVASVYNILSANIKGEAISAELLDSGYLAQLPEPYKDTKHKLVERFDRKFKREQKKQ